MEYKYSLSKRMELAGAHFLNLDYDSKCKNLHGHNWIITVYCRANKLNHNGMIIDFKHIKQLIHEPLDHSFIYEEGSISAATMKRLYEVEGFHLCSVPFRPTAENFAAWALEVMNDKFAELNPLDGADGECYKVTVQESEGNIACCTLGGCGGVL